MTIFLLVRHALHTFGSERIAGRSPEVQLSLEGQIQAVQLGERLSVLPLKAIYSSPLERTCETAQAIGERANLPVEISPQLHELDFGDWTGQHLENLGAQEKWAHFNAFRSGTRAPNGELMLEAQSRIVGLMQRLHERHPNECVALVSHGDVIKAAVAYFLGVPLDLFQRIEISPASVTMIGFADYGPWVLCVNHTGDLPEVP